VARQLFDVLVIGGLLLTTRKRALDNPRFNEPRLELRVGVGNRLLSAIRAEQRLDRIGFGMIDMASNGPRKNQNRM
jgi:hypothetical protein